MSEHWLVFARHDTVSDAYVSLTVGPVPHEDIEEFSRRGITVPFEEGEILLVHIKTFDHEPDDDDMDEIAPPGHKSTDG